MVVPPRSSPTSNKAIVSLILSLPFTCLIIPAPNLRLRPFPSLPETLASSQPSPFAPAQSHLPCPTSRPTSAPRSTASTDTLPLHPLSLPSQHPGSHVSRSRDPPLTNSPPDRTPPLSGPAQSVHGIPQLRHPATTATPLGYHVQP
jgi:hypothetical protein